MKPYKTIGYKNIQTKLVLIFWGASFLVLLNYFLLVPSDRYVVIGVVFSGLFFRHRLSILKNTAYEFSEEKISVHYRGKVFHFHRGDVLCVKKITRKEVGGVYKVFMQDEIYITCKEHLLAIHLRDGTTVIISPRTIQPWIFSYYTSPEF